MTQIPYSSILITGGTGSFGKAFAARILGSHPEVRRLVIFSRDELKQYEMSLEHPQSRSSVVRYFIGDVRDASRLKRACEGVELIIHAAALKQVPAAEYNPIECIRTNIEGAENVVNAALDSEVKCVVALSTDKAAAPINLYGATKLCSDKLVVAANNIKGKRDLRFSVVRYGNVMGSRGSVIPFFLNQRKTGILPITDPRMTRFNITLSAAVDMVLHCVAHAWGGEILVPKIPSYRIRDLAIAVGPKCEQRVVGIRPGEKIHEEMITESDAFSTVDLGDYYAILPSSPNWEASEYLEKHRAKPVPTGFHYNSANNTEWLTPEILRDLIRQHVDPGFEP